jgi:hypothetical protein
MKRRDMNVALIVALAAVAVVLALWLTRSGLAGEVERRGGQVVDEAQTPEGPTVSVVFTARPIGDAELACLQGRSGFQRLFLDTTRVRGEGLENLDGAKDLRWLSLGSCPVTDDGLKHLPVLPDMELLNLNRTQVTDAGLASLKGCKNLQRLFLSRTAVTDAGLEHLTGLTRLVELDAGETRVTEAGVRRLQAAVPGLTKVQFGKPPED